MAERDIGIKTELVGAEEVERQLKALTSRMATAGGSVGGAATGDPRAQFAQSRQEALTYSTLVGKRRLTKQELDWMWQDAERLGKQGYMRLPSGKTRMVGDGGAISGAQVMDMQLREEATRAAADIQRAKLVKEAQVAEAHRRRELVQQRRHFNQMRTLGWQSSRVASQGMMSMVYAMQAMEGQTSKVAMAARGGAAALQGMSMIGGGIGGIALGGAMAAQLGQAIAQVMMAYIDRYEKRNDAEAAETRVQTAERELNNLKETLKNPSMNYRIDFAEVLARIKYLESVLPRWKAQEEQSGFWESFRDKQGELRGQYLTPGEKLEAELQRFDETIAELTATLQKVTDPARRERGEAMVQDLLDRRARLQEKGFTDRGFEDSWKVMGGGDRLSRPISIGEAGQVGTRMKSYKLEVDGPIGAAIANIIDPVIRDILYREYGYN